MEPCRQEVAQVSWHPRSPCGWWHVLPPCFSCRVVTSPVVKHRQWRPGKLEQNRRLDCEPEISTLLLVLTAVGSVLAPSLPTTPWVHDLKP